MSGWIPPGQGLPAAVPVFTGKVDTLTVKLVPLNAAEEKLLQRKAQDTKNKTQ